MQISLEYLDFYKIYFLFFHPLQSSSVFSTEEPSPCVLRHFWKSR